VNRRRLTSSVAVSLLALASISACSSSSSSSSNTSASSSSNASAISSSDASAGTASGSSSQGPAKPIDMLTIASTPVKLLDAGQDYSFPDSSIQVLGLESLTQTSPDGKVEPALASSISNPSPTTYIYTLRSGVKFWDGSPLTPHDVVDSIQRYMKPDSQLSQYISSVKSVAASGANMVTITLKYPDSRWPYISAYATPVVEAAFAAAHPKDLGAPGVLTMGTGPYQFTKFVANKEIDLVANPNWWGGKVAVQKLNIPLLTDSSAIALALRAGSVDGYLSRGEDFTQFAHIPGTTLTVKPGSSVFYLSFNTNQGPWSDIHVRRAVAHLINRDQIIKGAIGGYGDAIDTLLPTSILESAVGTASAASFTNSYAKYPYDLAAAKKEMALSKSPNGFSDTLPIYPGGESSGVAQIVKQQLQQIGINLQLQQVPFPQWLDYFFGPRNKIGMVSLQYGGISYPSYYYALMLDSANAVPQGSNSADYLNKQVDGYLSDATKASSAQQSIASLQKVAGAEATDLPYIPLYSEREGLVLKNGFTYDNFTNFYQLTPWATHIQQG
jgi:peptide/nickel transport system substrate-binding protein